MNVSICVLCPYGFDQGLVSKAVEIAKENPVRLLIPKSDLDSAMSCGANIIHIVSELPADESSVAHWLNEKVAVWHPTVILAPATVQMRNIMPILAWQLNAGLTADCTEISLENGKLLQTRPAYGNSLIATIESNSYIQMATVRPGTFPYKSATCTNPEIVYELFSTSTYRVSETLFRPYDEIIPLNQASIIIAGGRGIGSKEGFQKLEKLAKMIGGTVAASRSAVDAGFASYHCQIGMTGLTVSPKIYIAIGISGAVQHLAGMSGSEKVIAINSNPNAPIFDYADYGIVGDWEPVVDKIMEELS